VIVDGGMLLNNGVMNSKNKTFLETAGAFSKIIRESG
jgi:hypothetical protein